VKKRVGVEASRNKFGADRATNDLRFLGKGTNASPFQQLQQDPLASRRGALSAEELIDQSSMFERGWRDLVADPTVRETFLMTPIRSLTGRKGFTPAQTTDLEGAGLMRLVDVLECFPRGYTTASLGCIPRVDDDDDDAGDGHGDGEGEGEDSIDQEHAVCVPVMLEDVKVTFGPQKGFSSWASMTTTFVALADSPGDSNGRQTRLVMRTFRKGRSARWILVKEEAALRRFGGTTFAVAGKIVRRRHSQGGPPTHVWTFKEQSVKLLSMDEYAELAANQRPHIMVSYSQRGSLLPSKLASATAKAMSILKAAVKNKTFQDLIPESIRSRYDLLSHADAVYGMHSPLDADHYERCRRRMAFQELFVLQLKLMMQRARSQFHLLSEESPIRVSVTNTSLIDAARTVLPYQLTPAQERAMEVLLDSFTRWPPAMVLLQGDVGSGKTICAFLSVLAVTASGYQTAIMAPTEILAEQHHASLSRILEDMRNLVDEEEGQDIPWAGSIPSVALLTGSTKRADRARILDDLQTGKLDIIVGTHAIISQGVTFDRLGLAVIDEQHKFGVAQRAKLLSKGSPSPHILSMSATPIPRSLALVNYGEMQLITIDELPPGRLPVTTHVLQDDNLEGSGSSRAALYSAMQKELHDGGQVYIVCPAIGEREKENVIEDEDQLSNEQLLKGAIQERDRLVGKGVIEGSQCSLLHGKMPSEEKERAMAAFASGRTPVLISTTVVEVGVDVPAASMIIVEHAERFGLAQLHQLRGRVGRGHRASTCFLVASASSGPRELERLRVLAESSSGFDIAEADFMLRGAGDIIGRRQSGKEGGGTFNVCSLPRDSALVELAREAAALHMSERVGSFFDHWPRELLAAVVDASVLDLDLASLPTLRSTDDD
jgi:ATP-dependent DNA helicase RecG